MKNASTRLIQKFLYTLMCSFLLIGCSTIGSFFDNSGGDLPAGAFRGTAAIRNQTMPLPVDIAENILAIENGQLVTGDSFQEEEGNGQWFHHRNNKPRHENHSEISDNSEAEHTHPFSGRKRWSHSTPRKVSSARAFKKGNRTLKYQVKNGDTLMKIAFAKYGDIFRWKDIFKDNQSRIGNYNKLVKGSTLILNGVPFIVIEKNGEPYLIRRGDTLVGISRKLYQSPRYWTNLWKNNTQLIHNPNKIYAGFKIYYRPKSEVIPGFRRPSAQPKK